MLQNFRKKFLNFRIFFLNTMQNTKNTNLSINFGKLQVPNNPIIHFIDGDGTGPDIWPLANPVLIIIIKKAAPPYPNHRVWEKQPSS